MVFFGCGTHSTTPAFFVFFCFFFATAGPIHNTTAGPIHDPSPAAKFAGKFGSVFEAEGGNKIPAVSEMGWWADGDRTTARLRAC